MKTKAVLKNLGKVSPIILLVVIYALPLSMSVLQDTWGIEGKPSVLFAYPAVIIIWLLLLLAFGLSFWHLSHRRRVVESVLALLFALPIVLLCVGTVRHAMTDGQVQLGVQSDVPVADWTVG